VEWLAPASASAMTAQPTRYREVQSSKVGWVLFGAGATILLGMVVWLLVELPLVLFAQQLLPLSFMVFVVTYCGRRKLITEVRGDVLCVRFWPARTFIVPRSWIRSVDVVPYYPGIDGQWGIRRGKALRIWTSPGEFVLVGTGRPEELRRLLVGDAA
jgi:hypothetical protein